MGSEAKMVRGQLRQIAKEILPELLTKEMFVAIQKQMLENFNNIAKHINDRLDAVDNKQKDLNSYVVRQLTVPAKVEEPTKTEQSS